MTSYWSYWYYFALVASIIESAGVPNKIETNWANGGKTFYRTIATFSEGYIYA